VSRPPGSQAGGQDESCGLWEGYPAHGTFAIPVHIGLAVGPAGFEPTTSCTPSCAAAAALRAGPMPCPARKGSSFTRAPQSRRTRRARGKVPADYPASHGRAALNAKRQRWFDGVLPSAPASAAAPRPGPSAHDLCRPTRPPRRASASSSSCSSCTWPPPSPAAARRRPPWPFYRCQLVAPGARRRPRPAAALALGDLVGTPHTSQFTRSVRCLYRWARLADPLDGITPPAEGRRERTLTAGERIRLLKKCGFELKRILWFLSKCGARPQELRELRWCEVHERERVIRLVKFKASDRRKDGVRVRLIPLPVEAARVLGYWRRKRQPAGAELVFANERGRPWTSAALRLAVARARRRARLDVGGGEQVVSYTLRHTFATEKATGGYPGDGPGGHPRPHVAGHHPAVSSTGGPRTWCGHSTRSPGRRGRGDGATSRVAPGGVIRPAAARRRPSRRGGLRGQSPGAGVAGPACRRRRRGPGRPLPGSAGSCSEELGLGDRGPGGRAGGGRSRSVPAGGFGDRHGRHLRTGSDRHFPITRVPPVGCRVRPRPRPRSAGSAGRPAPGATAGGLEGGAGLVERRAPPRRPRPGPRRRRGTRDWPAVGVLARPLHLAAPR
jgi:integrase